MNKKELQVWRKQWGFIMNHSGCESKVVCPAWIGRKESKYCKGCAFYIPDKLKKRRLL
jgi:hypothetical protein